MDSIALISKLVAKGKYTDQFFPFHVKSPGNFPKNGLLPNASTIKPARKIIPPINNKYLPSPGIRFKIPKSNTQITKKAL